MRQPVRLQHQRPPSFSVAGCGEITVSASHLPLDDLFPKEFAVLLVYLLDFGSCLCRWGSGSGKHRAVKGGMDRCCSRREKACIPTQSHRLADESTARPKSEEGRDTGPETGNLPFGRAPTLQRTAVDGCAGPPGYWLLAPVCLQGQSRLTPLRLTGKPRIRLRLWRGSLPPHPHRCGSRGLGPKPGSSSWHLGACWGRPGAAGASSAARQVCVRAAPPTGYFVPLRSDPSSRLTGAKRASARAAKRLSAPVRLPPGGSCRTADSKVVATPTRETEKPLQPPHPWSPQYASASPAACPPAY